MNKKSAIKVGAIILIISIILVLLLYSNTSKAFINLNKNQFYINEYVEINISNISNYNLEIISPSQSYVYFGNANNITFKPQEIGNYNVILSYNNTQEFYNFSFINSQQNTSITKEINLQQPNIIQLPAEINKPVKWTKKVNNTTEEYYTEAPRTIENIISEYKKQIIVYSPKDLNYENILSYTNIPETTNNKDAIKIYWKEKNKYVDFNVSDTNNNGLLDHIEWTIPYLEGNQTFEIIIEITKAQHLDENKKFIEDIYKEVSKKDGIFKEIPQEHYVRVTFKKSLTSKNDITIYGRSPGEGKIEVYEKDGNEKIADFGTISNYGKYQVFLDNLENSQDIFDLKVVNATVEFDYIVDPPGDAYNALVNALNPEARWPLEANGTDYTGNGHNSGSGSGPAGGFVTTIIPTAPFPYAADWDTDIYGIPDDPRINTGTGYLGYQKALSVWIVVDTIDTSGNGRPIWSEGGTTNSLNMYVYNNGTSNNIYCNADENPGANYVSYPIFTGTLYHVGCMFDFNGAGRIDMYINGVLVDSDDTSSGVGNSLASHGNNNAIAGVDQQTRNHLNAQMSGFFDGRIADLIYWSDGSFITAQNFSDLYRFGIDATPPNWSNPKEYPTNPATYASGQFYQFNVSWSDNYLGISTVTMQHNFTGTMDNYSISGNISSEYFYNYTDLSTGTYSWMMIANDSNGNLNYTDWYIYTVNKATPSVNLTLNGTDDNITIEVGSIVNITAYRLIGEGIIKLYKEGVLINEGNGPLENLTIFNTLGNFNITVIYEETQNYTSNYSTHYVTVEDTQIPTWQDQNQSRDIVAQGETNNLFATWFDNYNLDSVWLATNESGVWQNYTARRAGLTLHDFTDNTNIYIAEISATATKKDVSDGFVRDALNLSYDYDSGFADDTFDVVINFSSTDINLYENISYYVKVDQPNFHDTSLLTISSGTACNPTTPKTITTTNWNLITFNTADITGSCDKSAIDQIRIKFSDANDLDTGTGNITLDELYLTNTTLNNVVINFTWKNASIPGGYITWKIFMNDTNGNENSTDEMTFRIQDLLYPIWSSNITSPESPTTYQPNQFYQFNVTWIDNVGIQTVLIQHNFNGIFVNETVTTNNGDEYYYNISNIAAGSYMWQMIANDSYGNTNYTEMYDYTINKALSKVNLTLDNNASNITINIDSTVNLTGERLQGEGNIKLFNDGILINEGQPIISNLTTFNTIGDFNITVIYEETQNYTSNSSTYYIIVRDLQYPSFSNNITSPLSPATYSQGQFYQFNVTWADNVAILSVWIQHNFTGSLVNETLGNLSNVYYYNITDLSAGTYQWRMYANDSVGNLNQTDIYYYTINKAPNPVNLWLNGLLNQNITIQYPTQLNVTANSSSSNFNLYRDNTDITTEEGINITLASGLYAYKVNSTGNQNYTANTTGVLYYVNITKAQSLVELLLNGTNSNFSITQNEYVNITAYLLQGQGLIQLYQNNNLINNGSSPLENISYYPNAGIYNITLVYETSQNYTSNYSTHYIFVNDTVAPNFTSNITFPQSPTTYQSNQFYQFNVTWADNVAILSVWIQHNFTGSLVNETLGNLSNVYYYNITDLSAGTYQWRMYANDSVGNLNQTDIYYYTINKAPNPVNLWLNGLLNQNITIQYPTQLNVTANSSSSNYQIFRESIDVTSENSTNITLAANVDGYMYIVNSTGNQNYTANSTGLTYYVNITKAQSLVQLLLNGTSSNYSINQNMFVNITAYLLQGQGLIQLYQNNNLINNGSSPLTNISYYTTAGTYNITLFYPQTQNYTSNYSTYYIIVNDTTLPLIILNSPIDFYNTSNPNIIFNATINDNVDIKNVSLYGNWTGSFTINETNTSGLNNINYIFTKNIQDNRFIWAIQACDNSNNCNISNNRTLTIDTTPPNITESAVNITIATVNEYVRVNCTAIDALIGIDKILIEADKPTLPNQNYTTTLLSGNTWYLDIQLVESGTWSFNCYVNDTLNNLANLSSGSVVVSEGEQSPSIPILNLPIDGANLSYIPEFNWSNSTDPQGDSIHYILEIDNNPNFLSPEYYNGTIIETDNTTEDISVTLPDDDTYYWHVRASDGSYNSSFSLYKQFNLDRQPPTINLNSPNSEINITNSTINFNFTATDNLDIKLTCTLNLDNKPNTTVEVNNGLPTIITLNLTDGFHIWNVTCIDVINFNSSINRNFTIYTITAPSIFNISVNPDNETITLFWSNVSKAQYYNIYITTNYSVGFSSTPNITTTSLNWIDTNSSSYNKIYYKISAVNGPAEEQTIKILGKHKLFLNTTWNLLSLPLNITNFFLKNSTNNGYDFSVQPSPCITSIWRYNASQTANQWEETLYEDGLWLPATGDGNFTKLDITFSYWFEINETCNLTFVGEVPHENVTTNFNTEWNLRGWYSVKNAILGEEAVVGNPLYVTPENSITHLFRYNTQTQEFEGTTHFAGWGWWHASGSTSGENLTELETNRGYYFDVTPPNTWIHNPNYGY